MASSTITDSKVDLGAFVGIILLILGICAFSIISYGLLGGIGEGDYQNGQDTWTSEDIESSPFN
jgi:hypothetical protein